MQDVKTLYDNIFPPRTISKTTFRKLIENLTSFKQGLNTASRLIKTKSISLNKITTHEMVKQPWQVIDDHPLTELEKLEAELLLTLDDEKSCQLHIEFRSELIFLSVSDIKTYWGKSVYDEAFYILKSLGIISKERLKIFYAIIEILHNLLMSVASVIFTIWFFTKSLPLLYGSLFLGTSSFFPVSRKLYYFFYPVKKIQIICEDPIKKRNIPWIELSAILTFISSIISLLVAAIPFLKK